MEQQRQQMEYQQKIGQEQLQWEQERFGQEEERRQQNYLADLAANPISWLEYASASGEQPAVQPWMLPLMQGQYQGLQAGESIPGYDAEDMSSMPELLRPSRQLQARMGPTGLAGLAGYRQARTGIRPEELDFRQRSSAPPGGRFAGLSRRR